MCRSGDIGCYRTCIECLDDRLDEEDGIDEPEPEPVPEPEEDGIDEPVPEPEQELPSCDLYDT